MTSHPAIILRGPDDKNEVLLAPMSYQFQPGTSTLLAEIYEKAEIATRLVKADVTKGKLALTRPKRLSSNG